MVATFHGVTAEVEHKTSTFKMFQHNGKRDLFDDTKAYKSATDRDADPFLRSLLKMFKEETADDQDLSVEKAFESLELASNTAIKDRFEKNDIGLPVDDHSWPAKAFELAQIYCDNRTGKGMVVYPSICECILTVRSGGRID